MLAFIKGAVAAFSVVAAAAIGIGYILAGQAGLLDSAPGHTVSSVKAAHHRHHGHHPQAPWPSRERRRGAGGAGRHR